MSTESAETRVPLVLVTGASGYVATHLIKILLEKGQYRIRGTVRDKSRLDKVQTLLDLVPDAKYPLELVEAELSDSSSWPPAVNGCSYIFHVASPFPSLSKIPQDENVLIRPAIDGVLNVLSASAESEGIVKRVVLTSSVAAISCGVVGTPGVPDNHVYTEEDWSQEDACAPYEKSKLLAERAAWDFVKNLESDKSFELVVVNPGYIQGPLLSAASGAGSLALPINLMEHRIGGITNSVLPVVDVRDVAAAEIAAMFNPLAAGKRFLLCARGVTMKEVALILEAEFGPQGYNIPCTTIPKFVLWGAKFFDPSVKGLYPGVNRKLKWSNDKMISELGINPRPVKQTLLEMAYNIIELGIVRKTPGYSGAPSSRSLPGTTVDSPMESSVQTSGEDNTQGVSGKTHDTGDRVEDSASNGESVEGGAGNGGDRVEGSTSNCDSVEGGAGNGGDSVEGGTGDSVEGGTGDSVEGGPGNGGDSVEGI